MDLLIRFNRKSIDRKKIDQLTGLSKELIADQKVDVSEAQFLMSWLQERRQTSFHPIIVNLLNRLSSMLENDVLDTEESAELFGILQKIAHNPSELGQFSKAASLPVNRPMPPIKFKGRSFLFTGTCAFGTQKQCHAATTALGGRITTRLTKTLDYFVLGTYVTDNWPNERYGPHIDQALKYREAGLPLAIITEDHWIISGELD